MGEQHILRAPSALLVSSVVKHSHDTSADTGTCGIHSSCSERKGMAALSSSSISLNFQWSLRFCFLRESTRRLSNQPTSCERCQLSGDVKVSVIRWLLFCPHHTAQPLGWVPAPDTTGRGLWPRGFTPEVPFTSLTAASFYSPENHNCARLPNSSRA